MTQLTDYERNAITALDKSIHEGKWSNDAIVQLIEVIDSYGIIKTIPDYAKQNNLSYNGAKNYRNKVKLFNINMIIT